MQLEGACPSGRGQLEGACLRGRGQEREKESGESGIPFLFCIMPRKSCGSYNSILVDF